jgi:hypothetical protein|tara:strand:- start:437 stop:625 length:189 start_codon:yes stop_codon:yes gene_type:complete
MAETILQLVGFTLPIGIFYGATNQRIKALEKHIDTISNLSDRLARIEEKTNIIISLQNKHND